MPVLALNVISAKQEVPYDTEKYYVTSYQAPNIS